MEKFTKEELSEIEFLINARLEYLETMKRHIPKGCTKAPAVNAIKNYIKLLEKVRKM